MSEKDYKMALESVRDYIIQNNLYEPKTFYPEYDFMCKSFSRMAISEILNRMNDETLTLPWVESKSIIDILNIFIDEMSCYMTSETDPKKIYIFCMGEIVGKGILKIYREKVMRYGKN